MYIAARNSWFPHHDQAQSVQCELHETERDGHAAATDSVVLDNNANMGNASRLVFTNSDG